MTSHSPCGLVTYTQKYDELRYIDAFDEASQVKSRVRTTSFRWFDLTVLSPPQLKGLSAALIPYNDAL